MANELADLEDRSAFVTFVLLILLGWCGVHQWYLRRWTWGTYYALALLWFAAAGNANRLGYPHPGWILFSGTLPLIARWIYDSLTLVNQVHRANARHRRLPSR